MILFISFRFENIELVRERNKKREAKGTHDVAYCFFFFDRLYARNTPASITTIAAIAPICQFWTCGACAAVVVDAVAPCIKVPFSHQIWSVGPASGFVK